MNIFDPVKVSEVIKEEVNNFNISPDIKEIGRVISIGDSIARVSGLDNAMSGEMLVFENDVAGIAMNLEEDSIDVVLLGSGSGIREGDLVRRTGSVIKVPVGDSMLGRVVNALGQPLDQKGMILTSQFRPVERIAPGVLEREAIKTPLETGIKTIDSMVPIGRGQRQLIIGDRQTGKTAIALDTIINQKNKNVLCIYVAIGQKISNITHVVNTLKRFGAMEYTTIVLSGASDEASLQYLAPYSATAIAEEWMEQGRDVLIVYDDLSKHAVAYRTMSLLLKRPPGREAYPGDVFYLHSRLLERSGKLSQENGGGSITSLPIIETQAGDMSAYIPTNVISITDGQIYLEADSFSAGIRPAINPGLSVSRVGGAAQIKAMKEISAPIRTELAQYRELLSFSQFSSDLDEDTFRRIRSGERIVETLKQPQFSTMPAEEQVIILFAVTNGFFESVNVEDILKTQEVLLENLRLTKAELLARLGSGKILTAEMKEELGAAIKRFLDYYSS